MSTHRIADAGAALAGLNGIPRVDFPSNLQAAAAGRRMTSILREVAGLRRAVGRVSPAEYFYYRLWDADLPMVENRWFFSKHSQHAMHVACNSQHW